MRLIKPFFLLLLLSFIFSSCAPTTRVKIKLLKPAYFNISDVKKIAVLNLDFSGSRNIGYGNVGNYDNGYSRVTLTNKLINRLFDNGHYVVIDREQVSKLINKSLYSSNGFFDKSKAIILGKLYNVDAFIVGVGNYFVNDEISRRSHTDDYPDRTINYQKAKITRNSQVNFSYKVISSVTGEIIVSETNKAYSTDSTNYFPEDGTQQIIWKNNNSPTENPFSNNDSVTTDPFKNSNIANKSEPVQIKKINYYSISQKRSLLDSWYKLVDYTSDKVMNRVVKDIAPYYVYEYRKISGGNTKEINQSVNLVKKGLWGSAKSIWEDIVSNKTKDYISDHQNAYYNLGIYYEMIGKLDLARFNFNNAYSINKDKGILKDLNRIRKRNQELFDLNRQGRIKDTEISKDNNNYLALALNYLEQGNLTKAEDSFNLEIINNPDSYIAFYNLGLIANKKNNLNKAINYLNKSIDINSNYADSYYLLANLYKEKGNLDLSIKMFKEAFRINPSLVNKSKSEAISSSNESNFALYIKKAAEYYQQKKYLFAISEYKNAIKIRPNSAEIYYNIAISYHYLNKINLAKYNYSKSCQLGFSSACDILK